jgi:hypothetical protein
MMVSRGLVQAVLIDKPKKDNELRLGGHNIGPAPVLLDNTMKAIIIATIVDYATKCDTKPDWWTKEGGDLQVPGQTIFDRNNSTLLVNDRSALSFEEKPAVPLSPLEIALTPELCKIFKYLSSCLHLAGVTGHSAGGSAEAFAESTAPFHHGRPEGLEEMGDSFVKKMRRRLCTSASCSLGWAALLTRTRGSDQQRFLHRLGVGSPRRKGRCRPMEDQAFETQLPGEGS